MYPGLIETGPKPYASLDEMWKAFDDLSNHNTPAINGEKKKYLPVSSSGMRSSAPSGPRPAGHGRGQDRGPSQTSWQMGSSNNPIVISVIDPTTLGLITRRSAGPSKGIIMRKFLPFALRLRPTTLLSGAPCSRPPPAGLPSKKIGDIA